MIYCYTAHIRVCWCHLVLFAYSYAQHILFLTLPFCQADYKINNQTREMFSPCPCSMLICSVLHAVEISKFSHFMKFHIILTCIISHIRLDFKWLFAFSQRTAGEKEREHEYGHVMYVFLHKNNPSRLNFLSHFQIDEINEQSHVSTLATNKCILILMKQIDFQPHPYISTYASTCTCNTCVYSA